MYFSQPIDLDRDISLLTVARLDLARRKMERICCPHCLSIEVYISSDCSLFRVITSPTPFLSLLIEDFSVNGINMPRLVDVSEKILRVHHRIDIACVAAFTSGILFFCMECRLFQKISHGDRSSLGVADDKQYRDTRVLRAARYVVIDRGQSTK